LRERQKIQSRGGRVPGKTRLSLSFSLDSLSPRLRIKKDRLSLSVGFLSILEIVRLWKELSWPKHINKGGANSPVRSKVPILKGLIITVREFFSKIILEQLWKRAVWTAIGFKIAFGLRFVATMYDFKSNRRK